MDLFSSIYWLLLTVSIRVLLFPGCCPFLHLLDVLDLWSVTFSNLSSIHISMMISLYRFDPFLVETLHCFRILLPWFSRTAVAKTSKTGKNSLVWTPHATQSSNNDGGSLNHQKVVPYLFPWKRARHWRTFMQSQASSFKYSSVPIIRYLILFLFWKCN